MLTALVLSWLALTVAGYALAMTYDRPSDVRARVYGRDE